MNNMLWPYFKNLFLHFLTKKSRYTHQPGKSKYYSLRLKYAAFWKRLNFARTQKEHFSLFDQEKMINKFKIFLLIFPFSNGQVRFESTESTSTETSTMTPFFTMIFFLISGIVCQIIYIPWNYLNLRRSTFWNKTPSTLIIIFASFKQSVSDFYSSSG